MEAVLTSMSQPPAAWMERILDQMEEYDGWLDGWQLDGTEDAAE